MKDELEDVHARIDALETLVTLLVDRHPLDRETFLGPLETDPEGDQLNVVELDPRLAAEKKRVKRELRALAGRIRAALAEADVDEPR
jgi:hypothetical protein